MKLQSKISLVFAIVIFAFAGLNAQFVTPLTTISGPAEVTTLDGKVISGKVKSASFGTNGMMSFTVKDEEGNKTKYKAADVQQLKLKVDGLAKLEITAEQTSNIEKLANSNFKEVIEREFIYWQRVKQVGKDKYLLLQLLNPGFDSKLKVYDLPNSKSGETSIGGIAVSGDEATAYLVVKNGESLKITKKKYKKQDFALLFSDCQKIIDNNEPNFKEFATHVYFYDQLCD